ncbi:hypothetical protein [Pedobacter nutrimenti]|uniref:Uncharacterized protein n=1 Tax=Pedobacter nutrimenti TaxID=1241337 RepID=A0A318UST3_9SPHI|nr:hypothetical protein [Pedobacter nutrimenti]PYF74669.1 hypothetical protein B0O44_103114 [Pedobacter nutrimenti]
MKKVTFLLSALLLVATSLFAQEDHKHGSPHGGDVKSAGTGFHMEAVVKDGMVMVYLLDGSEKTMSIAGATATATIQTADGKISKETLKTMGKDSFMYMLDKTKKYNKAIVTIKTNGKTASASFDLNKKADDHKDDDHHGAGHKH